MLSPRWRKVFRDLWNNSGRTALVVLSIAVGVIAFGGLFATRTNLLNNLNSQFEASANFDIELQIPLFDDEVVRWAARQPNVTGAQGLAVYAEEIITDDETFDVFLYAYDDLTQIDVTRIQPNTGVFPPPRGEIAIERSFMEKLGVNVGDSLTLEVGEDDELYQLPISGTVYNVNVEAGFISDVVFGYTTTRTLRELDLPADYNRLQLLVDRDAVPDLAEFADTMVDDLTRLGVTVSGVSINEIPEHYAADNVAGIVTILVAVGSLSLVLSGFLVVNTISGLLAQQRKQIGIMKIIGASRPQIIGVYMVMVGVFGVLAMVIALPLSGIVARALSIFMGPNTLNIDLVVFRLPVFIIVIEIVVALMAPIISALVPVLSGTSVSAAAAISDVNTKTSNNIIDVMLARLSGLPTPYLISIRNTFRRKWRLLMTMITLVLAGAVFIAIVNVRAAVQTDVLDLTRFSAYDVQVVLDDFYENDGVQRRIQDVPGVIATEGWLNVNVTRVRPGDVQSEGFGLTGVPYDSNFIDPDMRDGRWLDPPTEANRYDLVVGHTLLDSEADIEVGDTLTLDINGSEQAFNVVGISWANNAPGAGGTPVYSYYDVVAREANLLNRTNQVLVQTSEETLAFQQQVERDIIDVLNGADIGFSSTSVIADFTESILDAFDIIVSLLLITATMIAIVGGLGLAGTMSLSVLERTREIGVMRSVGASTNTLRVMFVAEGALIGIMSAIISTVLGVASTAGFAYVLGLVIRERPWTFVFTASSVLYWFGIVLVVSAIASLLPAQRATQISIREAIAYD